ncbi:MAG: hypothetical protein HRU03_07585, partial [Nanoarchaeales archaeon]|nr:hypothetical protein [Nanoarchaeales archaeon]
MMGTFTAGALKIINQKYRNRIHSIYGTSTGASVGTYFKSNQLDIPYIFFTKYLTKKDFIRNNLFQYIFKIFFLKNSKIKDFVNLDYVVDVAKNTECSINLKNFKESKIKFYTKVINIDATQTEYLDTYTNLFDKLKATSQGGPFTSKPVQINNNQYIDGGTIPSTIDLELIKNNQDKIIIYINPTQTSKLSKVILYPLHWIAALAL